MKPLCASRAGFPLAVAAVMAISLYLRLPELDRRPMHGDEANQAVRTGMLLERGVYHYDPTDHHGPVLYFAALPFCRLQTGSFAETSEWNYRLVPVFFSCLTLLLMAGLGLKHEGGLFATRAGMLAAMLMTAFSAPMVYYSRFFIQETMFVTFLTGMLVFAVRYVRSRSAVETDSRAAFWHAAGFGACAGLAAATKETVALSLAAAAVAAVAAAGPKRLLRAWRTGDALVALGAAALVAVIFFSSFFTHPKGVYDALFTTVQAYLSRATTVPEHQHPWNFYLKILFWFKYGKGPVWSEAMLLFPAALAAVTSCWPRALGKSDAAHQRWVRFLVVYTLVLTAIYSAIPYKTPWCALSFLHGYILLAGIGAGAVVEWMRGVSVKVRWTGSCLFAVFMLATLQRQYAQAVRAVYALPADPRNPFVYAHTGVDALNLVAAIEQASAAAQGYATPIAVAVPTPDTWPLPWYLRKYGQVGYWTRVEDIPDEFAPVVVVTAAEQGDIAEQRFGRGKRANFFGIRPGVLLNLFVPER
ncbi:MAG: TIGR03663 family protein [Kiritimatiellae bacterium]|nr:TIGR03663 family protein [Kiritimatiellia bacterium]